MAKQTFLELTNRILARVSLAEATTLVGSTGHTLMAQRFLNESQNNLFFLPYNWYSLYVTRTFVTVASTAEYAVATDFGRGLDLLDVTGDRLLCETLLRNIDDVDPNSNTTGSPTHYCYVGGSYRLYPIPSAVHTIRDRYWKQPTELTTNAQLYDLPLECENVLLLGAWMLMATYMNKLEVALQLITQYDKALKKAKVANDRLLDRALYINSYPHNSYYGIFPPRFPNTYGAGG